MTGPGPAKPTPSRSEIVTLVRWVLSSWQRVLRLVVLISAPIVGILIFLGIAVTVIFYLKVDPQRWGAVLGLGVFTAGVARAVVAVRNRWAKRRPSTSASSPPTGKQEISDGDREPSSGGEGDCDEDVRN